MFFPNENMILSGGPMKTANGIQKTMLLFLFLSLAILLSACVVFVSVTKEEVQLMNDYILALRDEDYAAAIALSHPLAVADEDGLKKFIQGLKDDNIMFQGEMDPGLPVDVLYYSDVSDGVEYFEKTYDCD
jgi:ABC-type transporter Mla maintaining outer membrane lipid asymmetry ATPase subunit MlaF